VAAQTVLSAAVSAAASGEAVASATSAFFASAQAAISQSLGANASLAAEVLVLLSAF
jgi:hypothetical protein